MPRLLCGFAACAGGFGEVWQGMWGLVPVAIKLLHKHVREFDPLASQDFEKEALLLQSIRHPNVVVFYGAGLMQSHTPFLVIELMPLGSLKKLLRSRSNLAWPTRQGFAYDIAKGMEHLHRQGLVHRDLKSDNCLVNEQLAVKVADFGNSRIAATVTTGGRGGTAPNNETAFGASTDMTQGIGTILWRAPEVLSRASGYDAAIDVYSYAIVMWEIMTQRVPWYHMTAHPAAFESELTKRVLAGACVCYLRPGRCSMGAMCWVIDAFEAVMCGPLPIPSIEGGVRIVLG